MVVCTGVKGQRNYVWALCVSFSSAPCGFFHSKSPSSRPLYSFQFITIQDMLSLIHDFIRRPDNQLQTTTFELKPHCLNTARIACDRL